MLIVTRMTGVGGRPEVIIEGSNEIDDGWQEYHFLYKPGNVSAPLSWVGESLYVRLSALILCVCMWVCMHAL